MCVPDDVSAHCPVTANCMPTRPCRVGGLLAQVSFLDRELGVDAHALGRALKTCPKLLSMSLQQNLLPKAFFLKSSLGLSRADCGKLVRVF